MNKILHTRILKTSLIILLLSIKDKTRAFDVAEAERILNAAKRILIIAIDNPCYSSAQVSQLESSAKKLHDLLYEPAIATKKNNVLRHLKLQYLPLEVTRRSIATTLTFRPSQPRLPRKTKTCP